MLKRLHITLLALLIVDVIYRLALREHVRRLIHGQINAPSSNGHRQMNRQMNGRGAAWGLTE